MSQPDRAFNDWEHNAQLDFEKKMEESKKAAFEYYKEHKNLNKIYYQTDDKFIQQSLDEWQKEFNINLKDEEKKNKKEIEFKSSSTDLENKQSKLKNVKVQTNKANQQGKSPLSIQSNKDITQDKKYSMLISNNYTQQFTTILGTKPKQQDGDDDILDLDEMIEVDYPKEYNEDVSESLLKELGLLLNENRESIKKGQDGRSKLSNDDFRLLLCLLRLKKSYLKEKTPYYSNNNFYLKDIYTAKVEEKEEDRNEVLDFVKDFIESENNN